MAKCDNCRTIYDGWSCPTCEAKEEMERKFEEQKEEQTEQQERMAEEVLEEQRRIAEEATEEQRRIAEEIIDEQRRIAEESVEEHRRITAEASKLQAQSKVDTAYELYKADLYQDAIKHCLEAINLDRANIRSYRIAGWSYVELGQDGQTRGCLKKQISLLKTSYYSGSTEQALRVLKDITGIPNREDLLQEFLDASKKFTYFSADLIDELVNYSLLDAAHKLYLNTIANSDSLLGHAYGIELNQKIVGKADADKLTEYLKKMPYTKRSDIFEDFKRVQSRGKISENNINVLREGILRRYDEWIPEVKKEICETAAKQAKDKSISPATAGWTSGIGSMFFWPYFLRVFFPKVYQALDVNPLLGVVSLFGLYVSTGLVVYLAFKSRRNYIKDELIKSMGKKEYEAVSYLNKADETLHDWYAKRASSEKTILQFLVIFVLAIISIFLIPYVARWDHSIPQAIIDEFNGSAIGDAYGIKYIEALDGKGAAFSRKAESRVQYPFSKGFPVVCQEN